MWQSDGTQLDESIIENKYETPSKHIRVPSME